MGKNSSKPPKDANVDDTRDFIMTGGVGRETAYQCPICGTYYQAGQQHTCAGH